MKCIFSIPAQGLRAVMCCALIAMVAVGCSKRKEPEAKAPPPAPVSVEPAEPVAATEGGTRPKDDSPNPGLLKPGTINEDGVEVGAAALTDAVQNYYYATAGQVPESLEAMIKLKLISRIPTPPAGKKYVLDRKKAIVTLENAR